MLQVGGWLIEGQRGASIDDEKGAENERRERPERRHRSVRKDSGDPNECGQLVV